jgi:hypothetical protein
VPVAALFSGPRLLQCQHRIRGYNLVQDIPGSIKTDMNVYIKYFLEPLIETRCSRARRGLERSLLCDTLVCSDLPSSWDFTQRGREYVADDWKRGCGFTNRFLVSVPSIVTGHYSSFYRPYFKLCSRPHLIDPLFSCLDLLRVIRI